MVEIDRNGKRLQFGESVVYLAMVAAREREGAPSPS
jgi:hypothetical protein